MDLNCWIFLAAGVLVAAWTALAEPVKKQSKPLPPWLAPNWIFGDPTCDPTTAPLTVPARCAIWFGALVGAVLALLIFGLAFKLNIHEAEDLIPLAFGAVIAALCGWWGYRGANAATRYVMVRRATPIEVFIAGAAGAVVSVWFLSGAGSSGGSSSSSSSSSSSDSDRSSGGGSFGGGGASGSW